MTRVWSCASLALWNFPAQEGEMHPGQTDSGIMINRSTEYLGHILTFKVLLFGTRGSFMVLRWTWWP
jgi:hypothetical protein